jgi:hypothetical protein
MSESDDKIIDVDMEEIDAWASRQDRAGLQRPNADPPSSIAAIYIVLPIIFLAVTLLGGMRLNAADNSFVFLKPPLICLVYGVVTKVLFFRSGLISVEGWISSSFTTLQNTANGLILLTIFSATSQLFNSLLPEQGLPFWVVGFCFFWTLWNNLFSAFDTQRLLRSVVALFTLAFFVKYLILPNLTAPTGSGWLQRMIENPSREAFTWLLDLPRYGPGTGYIQFFAIVLYLIGLYLTASVTKK